MPTTARNGFSVIVPTYNRKRTLAKVLEALFAQKPDGIDYEIIVVDDCSTDGTGKSLDTFRARPNFLLIENESNLGRAKTRNKGVKAARKELLLFIDDDIIAMPGLLTAHAGKHRKHSEDTIVVGAVFPSPDNPPTLINRFLNQHHIWCLEEMRRRHQQLPYTFFKTANVSMRRQLLLNAGGFNDSFSEYGGEDTELGSRLAHKGFTMIFSEQAAGYHLHDESVATFVQKETERGRSLKNYYRITGQEPDTAGIFSPFFSHEQHMTVQARNLLKRVLFSSISRFVAYQSARLVNNRTNRGIVSFSMRMLLPLLKAQYQWKGCRENRH